MPQLLWYFEDLEPGTTIEVGSCVVSEEEIIEFAERYDPQPFHVDREAAADSIYGGIIASGWHTCAMMMRLLVDGFARHSSSQGSPGLDEVRWIKPVRPGDTLSVSLSILEARPSGSKPDRGVVVTQQEARNQRGELVAQITSKGLFLRRPPE